MTHSRKLLRQAAKALLIDQGPWDDRVYLNRMRALSQNPAQRSSRTQLPALVIYTRNERAELFNAAPRIYRCQVELVFEYIAADNETVDDVLDDGAEIIERIIGRNDRLGGTVNDTEYTGSQMTIVSEGDMPIGSIIVSFNADYDRGAPDDEFNATLSNLNTVATDYSLSNQQNDPADRARTIVEGLDQ